MLEFKLNDSLGVPGGSLFLFLFFGKQDFRFFRFRLGFGSGGVLLFVEVKEREGSLFAKFVSILLVSGFLFFERINNSLSLFVGAEELLSAESFDVRIKLDHDTQVLERILLHLSSDSGLFRRVDLALDLAGSY